MNYIAVKPQTIFLIKGEISSNSIMKQYAGDVSVREKNGGLLIEVDFRPNEARSGPNWF